MKVINQNSDLVVSEKYINHYVLKKMLKHCLLRLARNLLLLPILGYTPLAESVLLINENQLIVDGKITFDDANVFSKIVDEHSINHVIFRNSGGGKFDAGLAIGKYLNERKLTVEVEGICASACAIAMLGGETRVFSHTATDSAVMLHPAFFADKDDIDVSYNELLFDWIEQRTLHELPVEVKQMFHNISSRKGGLYVLSVHHRMVKKTGNFVYLCNGTELKITACKALTSISAKDLNIIED
jgi:hypothetical protein